MTRRNRYCKAVPVRERCAAALVVIVAEIVTLCDASGLSLTHPLRGVWLAAIAGGSS